MLPTTAKFFKLKVMEAVRVEVSTSVGSISNIAVYYPKQVNTRDGLAVALRSDIINLTRRREQYITGGDLNVKYQAWGNNRHNQNGTILNNDLQEARYNFLTPDTLTRLSRSGVHATIDIFISNMGNNIA